MSSTQFLEALYGRLPEFFKDEDELRKIWSAPDTRKQLLEGLSEMQKIIEAENSDLFDVLAYVAYAMPTLTREERATRARAAIKEEFDSNQQTFLEFVLAHYISAGVEELYQEKLAALLQLK